MNYCHHDHARDIATVLQQARLRPNREQGAHSLQASIAGALDNAGIDYGREHVLSPKDRLDFLCGDVAIEAKTRANKRAIYRQLERYAKHDQVAAIVLVTATAIGMPPLIEGKPVYVVSVGLGLLG